MEQNTRRAVLRPPTQSATPGVGITRIATSVTAAEFDLGAAGFEFFSKKLVLQNESATAGDSIFIAFAAATGTAISAATAGGSTIALGTVVENGFKLLPGASIVVTLSKAAHRYMHLDALANTPVLCIYPASNAPGNP